jgi:HK97 family phage portal protein
MSWLSMWWSKPALKVRDPENSRRGSHDSWAGKATTPDAVLQLATAWACIRLKSRVGGSLPLKVHTRGSGLVIDDHPLYSLLHDSPNANQTAMEFWEGQFACMDLRGNAYAEKVYMGQRLVALVPMHPDNTHPYRAADGSRRYRYYDPVTGFHDWGEDKVFHLRSFGTGGLVGLSPISYGRQTLGTALAADEVAGRTFANGLQVSGFAEDQPNAKTNQKQREELVELFDKFSGSERAGKVMPLPPGFSFKELSMKPEDAQLLETRGFHVEEICRWFGVFPILIGHAAQGQTMWGTGVESINLAWLTLYLGPELQRVEQAIEKQLMTAVDRSKFYVEHNVDALLRADSQGRAALYSVQAQNGLKTRNEMRRRENDPPLPGGDVLTVQSNLLPLDMLGKTPPRAVQPAPGEPI